MTTSLRDARTLLYRWSSTRKLYLKSRSLLDGKYQGLTQEGIAHKLGAITSGRIAHGPFSGLYYTRHSAVHLPSMVVGSYESELHPVIAEVISTPFDLVIEAGSAGGYYVIGLLARMPSARAIGFDTDYDMRYVCRQCARKNGVADRLTLLGTCTPEALNGLAGCRAFLICDIEGAEQELIDLNHCPALSGWDLLIESHEWRRPGITDLLKSRLDDTHSITCITPRPPRIEDWPVLNQLSPPERALAIEDARGSTLWLHLRAKNRAPSISSNTLEMSAV
jgi:hypothetical protein